MNRILAALAAIPLLAGTGCLAGLAVSGADSPGSIGLISVATVPHSYFSPTSPQPAGGTVAHGEACISSLFGLVTFGDGGYTSALNHALETSGASSLYDVRVDSKLFNILGIYATNCTELEGRV
ncbi:MAG: TRL domain-containing protein, partial [Deltaproteobacteria bacterium]